LKYKHQEIILELIGDWLKWRNVKQTKKKSLGLQERKWENTTHIMVTSENAIPLSAEIRGKKGKLNPLGCDIPLQPKFGGFEGSCKLNRILKKNHFNSFCK